MANVRRLLGFAQKDEIILNEAKKRRDVLYGSQAIRIQIGALGREPADYDILAKKPLVSAKRVEKRLDQASGGDYYYTQESQYHKGTYKVREIGPDNRRGTDDDVQIADYTKPNRAFQVRSLIGGLRVVALSESLKDKQRSVKDPLYRHRRDKDGEDINRIKLAKKFGYK